jgi:molybdopterin converting factor small subunit
LLTASNISAKVQLFADCDEKLKKQGEVLKERDGLLADVRDRLVADSGNVLGK